MAQPLEAILASIQSAGLPQSLTKLLSYKAVEPAAHGQPSQQPRTLQHYEELLQIISAGHKMRAQEAIQWLRDVGEPNLSHRLRQATRNRHVFHRSVRARGRRRT